MSELKFKCKSDLSVFGLSVTPSVLSSKSVWESRWGFKKYSD